MKHLNGLKISNLGQWQTPPSSGITEQPLKKGADVVKEALQTGQVPIYKGAPVPPPQPTNEQLFGHLVVTEEQEKANDKKWNDVFKKLEFQGKVDHLNKTIDKTWEYGKSFNSLLTKSELEERNKFIGKD